MSYLGRIVHDSLRSPPAHGRGAGLPTPFATEAPFVSADSVTAPVSSEREAVTPMAVNATAVAVSQVDTQTLGSGAEEVAGNHAKNQMQGFESLEHRPSGQDPDPAPMGSISPGPQVGQAVEVVGSPVSAQVPSMDAGGLSDLFPPTESPDTGPREPDVPADAVPLADALPDIVTAPEDARQISGARDLQAPVPQQPSTPPELIEPIEPIQPIEPIESIEPIEAREYAEQTPAQLAAQPPPQAPTAPASSAQPVSAPKLHIGQVSIKLIEAEKSSKPPQRARGSRGSSDSSDLLRGL